MNALAESAEILATARKRGVEKQLPYAGEVTPREAHRLFSACSAAIVDVRSAFEYEYIGRVPGSALVPWKHWPGGELNPRFLPELRRICAPRQTVLFLCRSGVRSHSAAATAAAAGYQLAFNITEGFEGDLDARGQRGRQDGWRHAGLPWIQS